MLSRRDLLVTSGGIAVATGLGVRTSSAREKDLEFLTTSPRNGQPELDKLVQNWLTPTRHFYVRSHAPNPKVDPNSFRLRIEGW